MQLRAVLLAALASCTAADAGVDHSTPYDCTGLPPTSAPGPRDPALETWHGLATAHERDLAWLLDVQVAASTALPHMSVEDRVRVQHELLVVGHELDGIRRSGAHRELANAVAADVTSLALKIAPTAAQLDALGASAHPRVAAILGDDIAERATRTCGTGNLVHVRYSGGLLAYRPLRAGSTRALVAQLVAIDTDGKAHITPLVDGMELRLGERVDAPACVVRSGGDGVLRPVAYAAIEEHGPFVRKQGSGLGCINCHATENAMAARDLTTALELHEVDAARDGQVERLASGTWAVMAQSIAVDTTYP